MERWLVGGVGWRVGPGEDPSREGRFPGHITAHLQPVLLQWCTFSLLPDDIPINTWFCFSLEWNVASIFAIESQYSSCKIFREWLLQCGSLISQSILDGIAQYRMGVDSWISLASKPLDEHVRAILFSVPVRFLVCWYVVKGCCYCFCVEVWTLIPSSSRCDTPFLCKPRQC